MNNPNPTTIPLINPASSDRSVRSQERENRVAALEGDVAVLKTDVGDLKKDVRDIKATQDQILALIQVLADRKSRDPTIPSFVGPGAEGNQGGQRRGAADDLEPPDLHTESSQSVADEAKEDPPAPVNNPVAPAGNQQPAPMVPVLGAADVRKIINEQVAASTRVLQEQLAVARQDQAAAAARLAEQAVQQRADLNAALDRLTAQHAPHREVPLPDPPDLLDLNINVEPQGRRSTLSRNLEEHDGIRLVQKELIPHAREPPPLTRLDPAHICDIFEQYKAYEDKNRSQIFVASSLPRAIATKVAEFRSHSLGIVPMTRAEVMRLPNHVLLDRLAAVVAPIGPLQFFEVLMASVPEHIPELDNHRYGADTLEDLMTHLDKYRETFETVYEFLASHYEGLLPPCSKTPDEGLIWLWSRALDSVWFKLINSTVERNNTGKPAITSFKDYLNQFFRVLGAEKVAAKKSIEIEIRNNKANQAKKITGGIPVTTAILGQHRPQQRASINNLELASSDHYAAQDNPQSVFLPCPDHLPNHGSPANQGLTHALQSIATVLDKLTNTQGQLAASYGEDQELEKLFNSPDNFGWAYSQPCSRPESDPDAQGFAVALLCQITGDRPRKWSRICKCKWKYGHCPGEATGVCKWDHTDEGQKQFAINLEEGLKRSRFSALYDPNAKYPTPPERAFFPNGQQRYSGNGPPPHGQPPPGQHPYNPRPPVGEPPRSYVPPSFQHQTVLQRSTAPNAPIDVHRLQAVEQQAAAGRAAESNGYESPEDAHYWQEFDPLYYAAAARAEAQALAATGAKSLAQSVIPGPTSAAQPGGAQAADPGYQR